jgi:hypothetical protein
LLGGPSFELRPRIVSSRKMRHLVGLRLAHVDCEHRSDRAGHLILEREDVLHLAVIALGPAVSAGLSVDELRTDADVLVGAPGKLRRPNFTNALRRACIQKSKLSSCVPLGPVKSALKR